MQPTSDATCDVDLDEPGWDGVEGESEAWFAEVYPDLHRFACVVAPADVDPDDLVQDALVGLLRRAARTDIDDARAYLHRSVLNLAKNHRRSWSRRTRALSRLSGSRSTTVPSYPSDLEDLLQLAPRERAALYLHVVDGYPYTEVAALLGCTEQAARQAAARGRRRLGEQLADEES